MLIVEVLLHAVIRTEQDRVFQRHEASVAKNAFGELPYVYTNVDLAAAFGTLMSRFVIHRADEASLLKELSPDSRMSRDRPAQELTTRAA